MAINDYCTNTEVKAVLPDGNWSTTYDTLLTTLATRASRAIDRYLKRKPGAFYVNADVTLYFDGSGKRELWIAELAAAPTSVQVAETGDIKTPTLTTWAASDYVLWPYNALDNGMPYIRLDIDQLNGSKSIWPAYPKAVKIVGKFGYSTAMPDDVKQAACIQTARWLKRGQQAFQDTGAVVELGQLTYTQRLDPDLANLIDWLMPATI
jgi:hypothetical protein